MLRLDSYMDKGELDLKMLELDINHSFRSGYDSVRIVMGEDAIPFRTPGKINFRGIRDHFSNLGYQASLAEEVGFEDKRKDILEIRPKKISIIQRLIGSQIS